MPRCPLPVCALVYRLMTYEMIVVMLLILAAIALFIWDIIPPEIVALGLMLSFVISGILTPVQAFSGFSSDTVMMILGLLIMTSAIAHTGILSGLSRWVQLGTAGRPWLFLLILLTIMGVLSSFMSNTAATALMVPMAIAVCHRMNLSTARVLLPMAFVSILAGTVTLIGTSTNMVISGLMQNLGLAPLRMFEMTPVGLTILIVGGLYIYFIGRYLIPDRAKAESLQEVIRSSSYLTEVVILENSPLHGKTLSQLKFSDRHELQVIKIIREETRFIHPRSDLPLQSGDVLLVEGPHEAILEVKDRVGIEIKANKKWNSFPEEANEEEKVVEALLLPRSRLVHLNLKQSRFYQNYGVLVLGLRRHGETIFQKISHIRLQVGDILLLQGSVPDLRTLEDNGDLKLLGETIQKRLDIRKGWLAIGIFVAVLLLAIFNFVSLPVAALLGAFLILATGCANAQETFREMEWKAVILIACMLSVGAALTTSSVDQQIGSWIVMWGGNISPLWLLTAFFVLTVAISQPMSNQAAAALIIPIAYQVATQLGLDPRPFLITIALAASCSFLTPLEPACLLVYGPGGYRFRDFLVVGLPLTFLILIITIWMVPSIWPLRANP